MCYVIVLCGLVRVPVCVHVGLLWLSSGLHLAANGLLSLDFRLAPGCAPRCYAPGADRRHTRGSILEAARRLQPTQTCYTPAIIVTMAPFAPKQASGTAAIVSQTPCASCGRRSHVTQPPLYMRNRFPIAPEADM